MPATEPAGGKDPVVKTLSASPAVKWFTDRFLVLVAAVFLLVLILILGFKSGYISRDFLEKASRQQKISDKTAILAEKIKTSGEDAIFVDSVQSMMNGISTQ